MVAIDRSKGTRAMAAMNEAAARAIRHGRQLIIFPEGTRKAPGSSPGYKLGITHLYAALGVPCLPVALNSGLYWPRRQLTRRPGTTVIEFLPPSLPGWTARRSWRRCRLGLKPPPMPSWRPAGRIWRHAVMPCPRRCRRQNNPGPRERSVYPRLWISRSEAPCGERKARLLTGGNC